MSECQSNEACFESMIESVLDYAIILLDLEGNVRHWNRGAQATTGYKAEEIIGQNFRRFFVPKDLEQGIPEYLINAALRDGRVFDEGQRIRKDGSTFWAHVTITATHGKDGEMIGYTEVTRDLTHAKLAEDQLLAKTAELESSQVRFKHMVEEVQDYAILLLDENGYVEHWNRGAEKIKGYTADEIVGKHFRIFYTEDGIKSGHPEYIINAARREGRAVDEGWRVNKDGSLFWAHVVFTAIHDQQGKVTGFSKVTHDLTETKRAEETLRAKNLELENFAFAASHDLKSPVRNISFLSSMIHEDFGDQLPADCRDLVEQISSTAQRMDQLVNAILVHARLGIEQSIDQVDLNDVVNDVLEDLAGITSNCDAVVQVLSLPTVRGNATYLRLLFQNLIENSLKYADDDRTPRIRISSDANESHCTITLADNGIGIPPAHCERIFTMFQRLSNSKARDGLGVGLAHCAKIVHLHSGKIWAESEDGQGSTMFIQFPFSDQETVNHSNVNIKEKNNETLVNV